MRSGYLLLYISTAWLAGIELADRLWKAHLIGCNRPRPIAFAIVAAILLLAAFASSKLEKGKVALWSLLLGVGLLGMARYAFHPASPCLTPADVGFYADGSNVVLTGLVSGYPEERPNGFRYVITARKILTSGGKKLRVRGMVLVITDRSAPPLKYGDEVEIQGRLTIPKVFSDFDYRAYLARKGINSIVQRPGNVRILDRGRGSAFWRELYAVRDASRAQIESLLPEPEASLLDGILLGIESTIPKELYDRFNRTGTSHIIVISGFNITIVAGLLMLLFGRIMGERAGAVAAVVGIAVYTLFVGANPPVVRAAFMGMIYVLAISLGRQSTAAISLFFSAMLMTAINPLMLWDLGFQLSFAATLSLVLFSAPIEEWAAAKVRTMMSPSVAEKAISFLNDALIVTFSAQILTVPLIAHSFHRVSLVSLPTNFFILPVQPYVMIGGGAMLAGAAISHSIGQVLAAIPWLFLHYTVWFVRFFSRMPLASVQVPGFGAGWLVGYYALVGAAAIYPGKVKEIASRLARSLRLKHVAIGLALLDILLWQANAHAADGRLHVVFLNVGDGESVLVQAPDGKRILINGGSSSTALLTALGRHMPFWDHRVEALIVSGLGSKFSHGLDGFLRRYSVPQVFVSSDLADTPEWNKIESDIPHRPRVEKMLPGARLLLGDGVVIDVLGQGSTTYALRVARGKTCFLLPADTRPENELWLAKKWGNSLRCAVLLAPESGRKGSSPKEFVLAVRPRYVVFSLGKRSRSYGYPDAEVLWRYNQVGAKALYTDRNGDIEFVTDGETTTLQER